MEQQQLPIQIGQLGIVREKAVDETSASPDTVELAINLNFDSIGSATLRSGITLLGAQIASGTTLGMENYRNNAGTVYGLLAKVASTVYNFNGTAWSSVRTGLGATSKARFTNFLDLTYMVDGNGGANVATYNGSTFGTTNVGSLPKGDYIENYRSRIWVANKAADKVYYSDIVSTSQTISGGTDFIQVSPQDGESITGLKRHSRALLVFKQNHIYKIYSTTSADPDPAIFRGTYSHESIVEAKDGIYYHHPTGFYKFVFDGEQQEISRPIIDIVEAISRSNYEDISGWADSDHIFWSIGDITLKGKSYTNVVCRYTISTQVWTLYSYPSQFKNFALYDNGTLLRIVVGDESGNVFVFDDGLTDNGTPIFYHIETHPLYFSQIKMKEKSIAEVSVLHKNCQGANATYQIDDGEEKKIGSISKPIVQAFTTDMKFKKARFSFTGNSSGSPLVFRGWEVLGLHLTGEKKK
ncbi:MAG: hypothetical protein WC724_03770 [Candidatus Paceibacterota bacterium]|jgi:hypothetical protein